MRRKRRRAARRTAPTAGPRPGRRSRSPSCRRRSSGATPTRWHALVERTAAAAASAPSAIARSVNAGTVTDQVGRFRGLADAGVDLAIVSLPDLGEPGAIERFGSVIAAFGRSMS